MRAVVLNCTLKPSPQPTNTGALASVVIEALGSHGVEVTTFRLADHHLPPGVESDLGEGDEWPLIRRSILDAEILVIATPTWVGHPSSYAQRAVERLDATMRTPRRGDWSHATGRAMAQNLVAVARALTAMPLGPPAG